MDSLHQPSKPQSKLTAWGRAKARFFATQVIRASPSRWADLKDAIADGHDVAGGGVVHVQFSGHATAALRTLAPEDRERFEHETGKPFGACALHLLVNAICGQIYARAKAATARSRL